MCWYWWYHKRIINARQIRQDKSDRLKSVDSSPLGQSLSFCSSSTPLCSSSSNCLSSVPISTWMSSTGMYWSDCTCKASDMGQHDKSCTERDDGQECEEKKIQHCSHPCADISNNEWRVPCVWWEGSRVQGQEGVQVEDLWGVWTVGKWLLGRPSD